MAEEEINLAQVRDWVRSIRPRLRARLVAVAVSIRSRPPREGLIVAAIFGCVIYLYAQSDLIEDELLAMAIPAVLFAGLWFLYDWFRRGKK